MVSLPALLMTGFGLLASGHTLLPAESSTVGLHTVGTLNERACWSQHTCRWLASWSGERLSDWKRWNTACADQALDAAMEHHDAEVKNGSNLNLCQTTTMFFNATKDGLINCDIFSKERSRSCVEPSGVPGHHILEGLIRLHNGLHVALDLVEHVRRVYLKKSQRFCYEFDFLRKGVMIPEHVVRQYSAFGAAMAMVQTLKSFMFWNDDQNDYANAAGAIPQYLNVFFKYSMELAKSAPIHHDEDTSMQAQLARILASYSLVIRRVHKDLFSGSKMGNSMLKLLISSGKFSRSRQQINHSYLSHNISGLFYAMILPV
ncbi:hypothetical protein XA68_16664 [Ophiocordyceps unilateralis]|uniref:Uncharacterized protein n=1 Tax=Ophiocordyceps unilateralis TaxID=268505 RepID=A0A2A9PNZ4_OPHUN|nr:hypothetical protein XA68_16664 [Ophiocordyceps unilateralis]